MVELLAGPVAAAPFQINIGGVAVTFSREISGEKLGKKRALALTPLTMEITVSVSSPVENAVLVDYFPKDWKILDARGGTVSGYDDNYNMIEWKIGSIKESATRSYVFSSPKPTSPQVKRYRLKSELSYNGGEAIGEDWVEILIGSALHLDENRNFISDISSEVKTRDNIWSEPIYENEWIRVTFLKELGPSNDITIYVRNLQQLNTHVEVYYPDSSERIAEFPIITSEGYYKIYLTNMVGRHDTFDLKVANSDPETAYLEFDHIIDPIISYYYVTSENVFEGGADNLARAQAADDVYENLYENAYRQPREIKTVVYYLGQRLSNSDLPAGSSWLSDNVPIYLPESGITIRRAWLELNAMTGTTTAANVTSISCSVNGGPNRSPISGQYTTSSGESHKIFASFDVTSDFPSSWVNPTYIQARIAINGAASNQHALLLYITYEYDANSTTQIKTVRYPLSTYESQINAGGRGTFPYNAYIPESGITVRKAWFEIRGDVMSANTADGYLRAAVGNDTPSTGFYMDQALRDIYDFLFLFKTDGTSFAVNSSQTLTVFVYNQAVKNLGGELVVTYEYPSSAEVQLKTVRYFIGQGTTRDLTTPQSFTRSIYIPEKFGVKAVWAHVRGGWDGLAGTITLSGSIGGQSVASKSYALQGTASFVEYIGEYRIIHDMSAAKDNFQNVTQVNVTAQYSRPTNSPPGIELIITYEYSALSPEELKTVQYLAGQSTNGTSTSYAGTLTTWMPENFKTRQSAYIETRTVSASVADHTVTVNINGSSSLSVDHTTSGEATTHTQLNGDNDNVIGVTGSSYTVNHSSGSNAGWTSKAFITYSYPKFYREKIQHNITGVASADNYSLEIRYYLSGDSEPVSVYLYNFLTGAWDNAGALTSTTPTIFTYDLTNTNYISGGNVYVRYVQPDNDNTQTSLMIDYTRVAAENFVWNLIESWTGTVRAPAQWH
ncbi:MAG: hypothetical protein ACUVQM_00795, partial [Candidatus Hadarchaeaceae archaeon]